MLCVLDWNLSITCHIIVRWDRLCDATHDYPSVNVLWSCRRLMASMVFSLSLYLSLKAYGLQITGASTPGVLMSRRKIMISLSPPIKLAAHARYSVGTRSSEKHGRRSRDVNMPHALSFVCPEICPYAYFTPRHYGCFELSCRFYPKPYFPAASYC